MKRTTASSWIAVSMLLGLAACRTSPAPDFEGRWRPVNHFPATARAIPLDRSYVFYASPMDGTLQQLLARWAEDSGMGLSYRPSADFTLHEQVAPIRTGNLADALGLLEAAYSAQGLQIGVEAGQIIVRPKQSDGPSSAGNGAAAP